jgi:hypothetical protein
MLLENDCNKQKISKQTIFFLFINFLTFYFVNITFYTSLQEKSENTIFNTVEGKKNRIQLHVQQVFSQLITITTTASSPFSMIATQTHAKSHHFIRPELCKET